MEDVSELKAVLLIYAVSLAKFDQRGRVFGFRVELLESLDRTVMIGIDLALFSPCGLEPLLEFSF